MHAPCSTPNQPLERTAPRCALRSRSTARWSALLAPMNDYIIEFNLVGNALDSIERAADSLAWDDHVPVESRPKQAILYIAHAIELLLKERLSRIHPSLMWEDVEKYPKLDARTVGAERALLRLKQIGNVVISESDARIVKSMRVTRNAIEHFE